MFASEARRAAVHAAASGIAMQRYNLVPIDVIRTRVRVASRTAPPASATS